MLKQSHHCTKRAAFSDASMSSVPARCCGWLAMIADGAPVEAAERGDQVRRVVRPAARSSECGVEHVVEHGAHVVRRGRARRHDRGGPGAGSVDRVVGVPLRRVVEVVRRQVLEDRASGISVAASSSATTTRRRRRCGGRGRRRRRAPGGRGRSPVKARDGVGAAHVRERVARSSRRCRRGRGAGPGPTHAGADHREQGRDDARRVGEGLGDPAPRVERRRPLRRRRRPTTRCVPTTGMPKLDRVADGPLARPGPRAARSRRGACRPRGGSVLTMRPSGASIRRAVAVALR